MTRAVTASATAFSAPPATITTMPFSTSQLLDAVRATHVLTPLEQKLYMRMIHTAGDFGIDNDFEIFQAAGYCFDLNFGKDRTHNIIAVADFLSVMGEKVKGTLGENDAISPDFFTRGRPGFFLATPQGTVYFIKEACDGSLVYYNPLLNAFADASSIPITGKEKLVVLNKSTHPAMETYCGAPTPDQPVEGKFYHEKQDGRKCGIHALHAFLGFPIVDETQLSLLKLEMTTDATYTSYLRRGVDPSLLPRGQIDHYKNIARFRLAQTSLFQADLGNNANHLLMLLQLLVRQGKIEPKYLPCRTYGIFLSRLETEYAARKGLCSEDQEWDEPFLEKLLIAVDEDLNAHRAEMGQIDQKLKEILDAEEKYNQPAALRHSRNDCLNPAAKAFRHLGKC